MSEIDPEKLKEALKDYVDYERRFGLLPRERVVIEAARAHLATLPRFKEVEVVQWCVITATGVIWESFDSADDAEQYASQEAGRSVVRLTGTAKVKVSP